MKETVILLDAGHGGLSPKTGTYTTPISNGKRYKHQNGNEYHNEGWFYEGVSNRVWAMEFIKQSATRGFLVVPVFAPSVDTGLNRRVLLANEYAKNCGQNTVFLSFHHNAFKGTTRGHQTYYHPHSKRGLELSKIITPHVVRVFEDFDSIGRYPERTAKFHVLQYTSMPALLMEFGFFDNSYDADLLMRYEFQVQVINGLLNGLDQALR